MCGVFLNLAVLEPDRVAKDVAFNDILQYIIHNIHHLSKYEQVDKLIKKFEVFIFVSNICSGKQFLCQHCSTLLCVVGFDKHLVFIFNLAGLGLMIIRHKTAKHGK